MKTNSFPRLASGSEFAPSWVFGGAQGGEICLRVHPKSSQPLFFFILFPCPPGEKLDYKACEALEEIFKRVQFKIVDLEQTSLDEDVRLLGPNSTKPQKTFWGFWHFLGSDLCGVPVPFPLIFTPSFVSEGAAFAAPNPTV